MSSHLETVQGIYAAFARGDIPAILDRLHEDVEWEYAALDHGIPWLEPCRGRRAVARFFETLRLLEIQRFEALTLFASGANVAALIEADLLVKATGRPIRDTEIHLWTIADGGRVTRFRHICDTHQHWLALYPQSGR
jgi:ketosteroid isomerase-like protein